MHNQPRYEPLEPSAFFKNGQASRQPVANTVPRGSLANEAYEPTKPGASVGAAPIAGRTTLRATTTTVTSPNSATTGNPLAGAMNFQTGAQPPIKQPMNQTGQPSNNPAGFATPNQIRTLSAAEVNRFPFAITAEVLARGETQYNISCSPCHGRTGYGDGMVVRRGFPRPPSYHTDQLRNATNEHFYDVITNGFGRMWAYADQVDPRDRWAVAAHIRVLQLSQNAELTDVPADKRTQLGQTNSGSGQPPTQPGGKQQ